MPDRWQSFPVEFRGGLVTNLSPLQQGTQSPGSATILRNFEPSIEGGYRRIEGYDKYSDTYVQPYGEPLVQGSSQTGTSLDIANIYTEPQDGDTFTIAGVSGTYTIATGGVSYNSSTKTATLTLTTSLDSSPADQALLTFGNTDDLVRGINYYSSRAVAVRNQSIFTSTGSGWTRINAPAYGSVKVNGGAQTGTSLIVDGLTGTPQTGDTFTVAGIEKVYTVSSVGTITSGGGTLTISPALASSPADNADITFLSSEWLGGTKTRFAHYNFSGTEKLVLVNGSNTPATFDGTDYLPIQDIPADIDGAEHVVEFKSHLFFAKGTTLSFSAPFSDTDFSAASGAGVIEFDNEITDILAFREQLIIFTKRTIFLLAGSTIADFQVQPITKDIGAIQADTVQEVGGDLMFLAADGFRLLSGTERNNDFGLGVVSKVIQSEVLNFIEKSTSFASVVIRGKSQYRILGYNQNFTDSAALGIMGVQFAPQGGAQMAWAETRGINAYVAYSEYVQDEELILFANDDGYVYRMESGNSFDGSDIPSTFTTPYLSITDPTTRKNLYKMKLFFDPEGSFSTTLTTRFDFDQLNVVQPNAVDISNVTATGAYYGAALYGGGTYAENLKYIVDQQLVGSGFVVSFNFESISQDPSFALDAMILEYGQYGRR